MKIRPFIYSMVFLLLTVVLSIAVGAVFIPPADVWRVLTGQPAHTVSQAATIVLTLRLIDSISPVVVADPASGNYCLIMPCRLTAEAEEAEEETEAPAGGNAPVPAIAA